MRRDRRPASKVIKEEMATSMRLLGVTAIDQLTPEMVRFVDREPAPLAGWRGGSPAGGGGSD